MSLLLDALKRAEEAKRNNETPDLQLEPVGGDMPAPKPEDVAPPPLITRDRLPDISQSLEILADDLPPPLKDRRTSERANTSSAAGGGAARQPAKDQAQAAARRLFDAKPAQGNPQMPFYIVCGVLAMLAIGVAIYFWYQLQPRTQPAAIAQPPAAPPVATAPAVTRTPLEPRQVSADEMIVPPLPSAPSASRRTFIESDAPPRPEVFTPPSAPTSASRSASQPSSQSASQPALQPLGPNFNRSNAAGPTVTEDAYAAYQRGDYGAARAGYEKALAQNPDNFDAQLGLASLDVRAGRADLAEARYLKTLERDPRNAHAQAGLIAVRGQTDPVTSENRLKQLLSQQPDSAFLNFALANVYGAQGRWGDAQQLYFKAYVAEPENPDYAFNLAVSLDHIRQGKVAAEYYRKALSDPAQRGNFNRSQAEVRLRELTLSQ